MHTANKLLSALACAAVLSACTSAANEPQVSCTYFADCGYEDMTDSLTVEMDHPLRPSHKTGKNDIANGAVHLGIMPPDDYIGFIKTFGYGRFGKYITVCDYFCEEGLAEYDERSAEIISDMEESAEIRAEYFCDTAAYLENGSIVRTETVRNPGGYSDFDEAILDFPESTAFEKMKLCGTGYPYRYFEDNEGLIYFGSSDVCNFFWNVSNDGYTVVMYCGDDFYEFEMSFSEFIYSYLSRDIVYFEYDTAYQEYE